MLTPEGYKSRLVEKQFDEYMQTFGAVCIEGPKYCGKPGRLEAGLRVQPL